MNYIAFICLISQEQQILSLLKQKRIFKCISEGLRGRPKKNLERIRSEKEVLQAKIQEMKTEASKMANLQSVEKLLRYDGP